MTSLLTCYMPNYILSSMIKTEDSKRAITYILKKQNMNILADKQGRLGNLTKIKKAGLLGRLIMHFHCPDSDAQWLFLLFGLRPMILERTHEQYCWSKLSINCLKLVLVTKVTSKLPEMGLCYVRKEKETFADKLLLFVCLSKR